MKELRKQLNAELSSLRASEKASQKGRERSKKRAKFVANPYKFTSDLLGGKKSTRLNCTKEELGNHLEAAHTVTGTGTTSWDNVHIFWMSQNQQRSFSKKNQPGLR